MNAIEELQNNYQAAASNYHRASLMNTNVDYVESLKTMIRFRELYDIKKEAETALILGLSRS